MPSRAFWKAWRAEPTFFAQKLEPKPSRAEPSFGSDPTLVLSYESYLLVMDVGTRPKSDLFFMFYMHFEGHSNLG